MERSEILKYLPQADPFVFVDSAKLLDDSITGEYTITGDECFMSGHFPGRPIFPASIMVEALGQLGIVYMMASLKDAGIDPESIFFIKSEDVICRRKCFPGDRLELSMRVIRTREPLALFSGTIVVGCEMALKVTSMSLSFSTQGKS
jgi:3-hydroxyacyl-[acyl-carrier-protein] dehydratase